MTKDVPSRLADSVANPKSERFFKSVLDAIWDPVGLRLLHEVFPRYQQEREQWLPIVRSAEYYPPKHPPFDRTHWSLELRQAEYNLAVEYGLFRDDPEDGWIAKPPLWWTEVTDSTLHDWAIGKSRTGWSFHYREEWDPRPKSKYRVLTAIYVEALPWMDEPTHIRGGKIIEEAELGGFFQALKLMEEGKVEPMPPHSERVNRPSRDPSKHVWVDQYVSWWKLIHIQNMTPLEVLQEVERPYLNTYYGGRPGITEAHIYYGYRKFCRMLSIEPFSFPPEQRAKRRVKEIPPK